MKIDPSVETVDACILCRSLDAPIDGWFAQQLGLVPPYAVRQCRQCGLRWLSPRPTPRAYAEIYTHENYFETKGELASYEAVAEDRRPYFRSRIRRVARFKRGRSLCILDVGAATGEFVDEARHAGHRADGIELSDSARLAAFSKYGIRLSDTSLVDLPGTQLYDTIHMNHVLEHLPDPLAAVCACRRLLRPDGLLVIEVPQQISNDLDRLRRLLPGSGKPSFNAYSLHHTYFFTPLTLTRLLGKGGFEVRHIATSNPARTPLLPFRMKNLFMRVYLWAADRLHSGGNIIEAFAVPTATDFKSSNPDE